MALDRDDSSNDVEADEADVRTLQRSFKEETTAFHAECAASGMYESPFLNGRSPEELHLALPGWEFASLDEATGEPTVVPSLIEFAGGLVPLPHRDAVGAVSGLALETAAEDDAARERMEKARAAYDFSRRSLEWVYGFVARHWERWTSRRALEPWPENGPAVENVQLFLYHVQQTPSMKHISQLREAYMQRLTRAFHVVVKKRCAGVDAMSPASRRAYRGNIDWVLREMRFIPGFSDTPLTKEAWGLEVHRRALSTLCQEGSGLKDARDRAVIGMCMQTGDRPGTIGPGEGDSRDTVVLRCRDVKFALVDYERKDKKLEPRVKMETTPQRFKAMRGVVTDKWRATVTAGGDPFEDGALNVLLLQHMLGRLVEVAGNTEGDRIRNRLVGGLVAFWMEVLDQPLFSAVSPEGKVVLTKSISAPQVSQLYEAIALRMGCEPGKSSSYSSRKFVAQAVFATEGVSGVAQVLHYKGTAVAQRKYIGDGRNKDMGAVIRGEKEQRAPLVSSLLATAVKGQPLKMGDVPIDVLEGQVFQDPDIVALEKRLDALREELGVKNGGRVLTRNIPQGKHHVKDAYVLLLREKTIKVKLLKERALAKYRLDYWARQPEQMGVSFQALAEVDEIDLAGMGSIEICQRMVVEIEGKAFPARREGGARPRSSAQKRARTMEDVSCGLYKMRDETGVETVYQICKAPLCRALYKSPSMLKHFDAVHGPNPEKMQAAVRKWTPESDKVFWDALKKIESEDKSFQVSKVSIDIPMQLLCF